MTPGRNLIHDTFLDPAQRENYIDWPEIVEGAGAGLSASAEAEPDDPPLTQPVGALSLNSEEFRRMWARHDVRELTGGIKRFNNPFVGPITLNYQTFNINQTVGPALFSSTPTPAASKSKRSPSWPASPVNTEARHHSARRRQDQAQPMIAAHPAEAAGDQREHSNFFGSTILGDETGPVDRGSLTAPF